MTRHPFGRIPVGKRGMVFISFMIVTLGTMGVLNVVDGPLKTPVAPQGIVSFELAGSASAAQAILDSWGPVARVHAGFSLGLDFLFLILYSTTISLACIWGSSILRGHHQWLVTGGVLLAWAQWLAALLDAVENVALVVTLTDSAAAPWPQLARWCAVPKFVLVFLGLGYAVLGVAVWLWSTKK